MKRVLIIEAPKSYDQIIISGSYWFRLEMAYGMHSLGLTVDLVQHPKVLGFSWVNYVFLPSFSNNNEIKDYFNKYDLVVLLNDTKIAKEIVKLDIPVIYWDIEGFPSNNQFFNRNFEKLRKHQINYYGAKFDWLEEVLSLYYYHFKNQRLKHWAIDHYFSTALYPLIRKSAIIQLGAEPSLYPYRKTFSRDINLAILGSTSRWFEAEDRINIVEKELKRLQYPVCYWYGSYPEVDQNKMPKNCYSTGHIDFFSLPYFLQRIKRVIHVPRPYHLETQCLSATLFQTVAGGGIPIHFFNRGVSKQLGYNITEIEKLDGDEGHFKEEIDYPTEYTYKERFKTMLKQICFI